MTDHVSVIAYLQATMPHLARDLTHERLTLFKTIAGLNAENEKLRADLALARKVLGKVGVEGYVCECPIVGEDVQHKPDCEWLRAMGCATGP